MTLDSIIKEVGARLARESGLNLDVSHVSESGHSGLALSYASQAEDGLSFSIFLSSTMRRAEAVFRPSRFAGPLVRSMCRHLSEDQTEWNAQLQFAEDQDIAVTLILDSELMTNSSVVGERDFREIEIECVVRHSGGSEEHRREGLLLVARSALSLVLAGLELSSDLAHEELVEGAVVRVEVNKYERNPIARMRCIEYFGDRCWVCELSFGDAYGPLGSGFIHVHHRVLVASMQGAQYVVDPIRDLVPLCPNCHSMIHRRNPPLEPAELRSLMGLDEKSPLPAVSR